VHSPTSCRQLRRSRAVRSRNREAHRKTDRPNEDKKRLNQIRVNEPGVAFQTRSLPRVKCHVKSLNMLTSKAWIKTPGGPCPPAELPYIDVHGKFTGRSSYKCSLAPQSYMSVVISTIFRRLKFWSLRHNSLKLVNINQNTLLKCSAYYALTKNVYFWNRLLFLTKDLGKNRKSVASLLFRFSQKLDAHKWFVYGHVCLQTQWLTSRAVRPRDKSAILKNREPFFLPTSIRSSKVESARFGYDSVWSCFVSMAHI
jgi:hypothetical protein